MLPVREFQEQFGFLTIAQNTDVDYLQLAYEQAKDRKSTRLNSSHTDISRMPSSA